MKCIQCKTVFMDKQSLLNHLNVHGCVKAKKIQYATNICTKCKQHFGYSYYLFIYKINCQHISGSIVSKL